MGNPDQAFVDVYAAANKLEADRVLSLLNDDGIEGHASENKVPLLPTDSGHRYVIAVAKGKGTEAATLIDRARTDGVITEDGTLLALD